MCQKSNDCPEKRRINKTISYYKVCKIIKVAIRKKIQKKTFFANCI